MKIPVAGINIGPVHKKDITKVGISGVRGDVRGTRRCPEYEEMSGVRGDIRGTRRCPGYEEMSGVRGDVRGIR